MAVRVFISSCDARAGGLTIRKHIVLIAWKVSVSGAERSAQRRAVFYLVGLIADRAARTIGFDIEKIHF